MTSSTNPPPDTAALAPAVAALLGPEWSAHRDMDGLHLRAYCLRHRDGRQVRLAVHPDATGPECGRLFATGLLPENPDDVLPYTTDIWAGRITMAGTKTAQQIAADIARHLLPVLTTAHAIWHSKVRRLRAHEACRKAVAEQLAAVPGMSSASHTRSHNRSQFAWHLGWEGTGRAPQGSSGRYVTVPRARVEVDTADDGESIRIELSGLSGTQAERVLRALAEQAVADPAPELNPSV